MTENTELKKQGTARKLVILAVCAVAIAIITYFGGRLGIESLWLRRAANCGVYVLLGVCGVLGMKLSKISIKEQLDFRGFKQYLWAIALFALLSLSFAVLPILFGGNLIGPRIENPEAAEVLYNAFFYIVFVGPVEELVFRGYIQEIFAEILPKNKWLSAVITAAIFGLWHWINGSYVQVIFTFIIGLIIGLSKYFLKNCTLISVSIAHGLYDFFNIVWRILLV